MAITIEEAIESRKKLALENRNVAQECRTLAERPMEKMLHLDKMHEKDAAHCIEQAEMQESFVSWLEELLEYRRFGTVRDIEKVMGSPEDY